LLVLSTHHVRLDHLEETSQRDLEIERNVLSRSAYERSG
jgi:hypothetical protein